MKRFIVTFLIFFALNIYSQDDVQLAFNYFNSQEYTKAADVFKQLWEKQKISYFFEYYIKSLVLADKSKKALREIDDEINKNADNQRFLIAKIYVFTAEGKLKNADQIFEQILANLPNNPNKIRELSQVLISFGLYDKAEKLLIKASDIFPMELNEELANIYYITKNDEKFIDTYLKLVSINTQKVDQIKFIFSQRLINDPQNLFAQLLEKKLLQKSNENIAYKSLLIWFYTQIDQFSKALSLAMEYDKRFNLPAQTYFVGVEALNSKQFLKAIEAFDFVKSYGKFSPYYKLAFTNSLNVYYQLIKNKSFLSEEEKLKFENEFDIYMSEGQIDINILLKYIEILTNYFYKPQKALDILNSMLQKPLSTENKGKLLLQKADVLLFSGQIYEALLLYAQISANYVDYTFADDAKFKKAKCYYYLKNFDLAKNSFDALKGSTSKLIANEAIYMSFFIDYTSEYDTTYTVLSLYSEAEYAYLKNDFTKALQILDTILKEYSYEVISEFSLFLKAQIKLRLLDTASAETILTKFLNDYKDALIADKALYILANIYENQKLFEKTAQIYQDIFFNYPLSYYAVEAKERFLKISEILNKK